MTDWQEIRAWRKAQRQRLLSERAALPAAERERLAARIREHVIALLGEEWPATLGLYWPINAELDMVPIARLQLARGGRVGLPVVVEKAAPVEFWNWRQGLRLVRGAWDIPVPKVREVVVPDLCIVPLVGFDRARYRLGYGGGYYDRTLAAASPRPRTIAIGLSSARLDTIHPQPHDIRMDVVVTEHGPMQACT
jgi:5-formyltetrahydrofolate cyclo-ligase